MESKQAGGARGTRQGSHHQGIIRCTILSVASLLPVVSCV